MANKRQSFLIICINRPVTVLSGCKTENRHCPMSYFTIRRINVSACVRILRHAPVKRCIGMVAQYAVYLYKKMLSVFCKTVWYGNFFVCLCPDKHLCLFFEIQSYNQPLTKLKNDNEEIRSFHNHVRRVHVVRAYGVVGRRCT